jgi:hypothetical protein
MAAETTSRTIKEEQGRRIAADAVLAAAIADLAGRVTKLEAPVVPPPVIPPPGQKVVAFSGTAAQLVALMADTSVDVIEMVAGTYARWSAIINVARPTTRPLLVRPAGAVIFDGTGMGGTPPFYVGWNSLASYITFDPAGTGGSFTIQNYAIAQIGLVDAKYTDHVTFNGIVVRNCTGTVSPQTSHCLYVESDGTHRSKAFTANGWDVVGPTNRYLNGVQTYHAPNVDGLTLHGWKVTNLHRAGYLYADATGVDIDGWTIADCDATFDAQDSASGTVRNCHATNSGTTKPGSGYWTDAALVDGGGNTWA